MAAKQYECLIVQVTAFPNPVLYRAEIWYRPFTGNLVASTREVKTKAQATKDAKRWLRVRSVSPV